MSKRRLLEVRTVGLALVSCAFALSACDSGTGAGAGTGGSGGTGGSLGVGGSPGAGGAMAGGSPAVDGSGAAPQTGGNGGEAGAPASGGGGTGSGGGSGGSSDQDAVDVFGITKLYPSSPGGAEWDSAHWNEGAAYAISERIDENDPLEISGFRGEGTLDVTGSGELVMGGPQPRIYVYPEGGAIWRDIEVTVYYQRVDDAGTAYAGLVVGVRSGDGHNTDTACEAHTYYARLRHDGDIDFEKELKHPASSTQGSVDAEEVWPPDGVLPTGQWIGWKFVIYNLGSSSVQLESYRDLALGEGGGDWELMNETVDDGGWSVESDCPDHNPVNGESDMIVMDGGAVLVRNTDVSEARYRWMSIREILPP